MSAGAGTAATCAWCDALRLYELLLVAGILALATAPTGAGEVAKANLPTLHCTLQYGGKTIAAEFKPSASPYEVQAVDIDRFRVKAIIAEDGGDAALVKIYSYHQQGEQFSLLHLAKHRVPLQPGARHIPLSATKNYIYSPRRGYELIYECSLSFSN